MFLRAGCFCLFFVSLTFAQTPIQKHAAQAAHYLASNRPDLAAVEFQAMIALDPNNADAQSNLGVLLFFQGEFARAVPHLRAALKLKPDTRTQALLGMSEKRTGEVVAAESDLSRSFSLLQDPRVKLQAGLELAEIYHANRQPDRASGVVSALSAAYPENADVLYLSYRIYSELARESALGIATFAPDSSRMKQVSGQELARQGKYTEAIARYREALRTEPHLSGAHFDLAEMLNITGDYDSAQKEYESAIADNPDDAQAESRLGDLAMRATDLTAASKHYMRALELHPEDVDSCMGMAKILIAQGRSEQALPLLERAVKIEPLEAVIHYQLGIVYRSLGRAEDSRRELADFTKLKGPGAELRRRYRDIGLQPGPERQQ